ncbi:MAG: hypothetical protein RL326_2034 [Pseudomonadota bacterium]|jgi:hypothetical protein
MTAFAPHKQFGFQAAEDGAPDGTRTGGGTPWDKIELELSGMKRDLDDLEVRLQDLDPNNPERKAVIDEAEDDLLQAASSVLEALEATLTPPPSAPEAVFEYNTPSVYDRGYYKKLAQESREAIAKELGGQATPYHNLTEEQYVALLRLRLSHAFDFNPPPGVESAFPQSREARDEAIELFEKARDLQQPDDVHVHYTFKGPGSLEDQLSDLYFENFGGELSRNYEKCTSPTDVLRSRVTDWIRGLESLQSVGVFPEIPNEARAPSFESEEAYEDAMQSLMDLAHDIVWQPLTDEDQDAVASGDRRYSTPEQLDASRDAAISVICENPHFIFEFISFLKMVDLARVEMDLNPDSSLDLGDRLSFVDPAPPQVPEERISTAEATAAGDGTATRADIQPDSAPDLTDA